MMKLQWYVRVGDKLCGLKSALQSVPDGGDSLVGPCNQHVVRPCP